MGLLGMLLSRQLLTGLEQKKVLLVIMYGCIILSLLFMLGVPNLLKFYYVKKYKDILNEDLKKSLQEKKIKDRSKMEEIE